MRAVRAIYVDGCLRPAVALPLADGARVRIVLTRQADSSRWRLIPRASEEDVVLAEAGLAEWLQALDAEDRS